MINGPENVNNSQKNNKSDLYLDRSQCIDKYDEKYGHEMANVFKSYYKISHEERGIIKSFIPSAEKKALNKQIKEAGKKDQYKEFEREFHSEIEAVKKRTLK